MGEYFVKQSYGIIWHFCCNQQGICFCNMTSNKINSYELLVPGGQSDFDIVIDKNNGIHLVCQNDKGEILYLKNNDTSWKKYVVLKSKTQSCYKKEFKIIENGGDINVFYTIEHKGKRMLTKQIMNSSAVPVIIDYIHGNFDAVCDDDNIYILYYNDLKKLGRRKISKNNDIGAFTEINTTEKINSPQIYVHKSKFYVIGTTENANLLYIKDGEEKLIDFEAKRPIFVIKDNEIYIMWENINSSRIIISKDGEKPTEFMAGRFSPAKIFSVRSADKSINSGKCYGYINNNVASLYLLNNFFEITRVLPKEEEQKDIFNLKKQIAKLELEINELKKRIGNR